MAKTLFSYPDNDEDVYLSWFKGDFSSVFVATSPFLNIPRFPIGSPGERIPNVVTNAAKQRGAEIGVTWEKISELCGFPSIAHVNRALRLTGSKRMLDSLASPADTDKLLELCLERDFFIPDEGCLSPLCELSMARFLKKLGQNEVVAADHFGSSPRLLDSEIFARPEVVGAPEIHARDKSIYVSMYIDYHYFLICQTDASRSQANPADFFEGFFADRETNDLWGVGDLS